MSPLTTSPSVVAPKAVHFEDLRRVFSNFDFIELNYGKVPSIRRLFSLSRAFRGKTLVVEDIPAVGIVAEENAEIRRRYPNHKMGGLQRLTFWRTSFDSEFDLANQQGKNLLGYAILKQDIVPTHPEGNRKNQWHVFESVFVKYPHVHNYVHCARTFELRVGLKKPRRFEVEGVLYCQQNGLNKACAQVALRSLLEPFMPRGKQLSYGQIHRLAKGRDKDFDPGKGLVSVRIERVLKGLGFRKDEYSLVDYEHSPSLRRTHKYQNYLYTGLESGTGALLGFKLTGPKAPPKRHIIPVFGHTFNQDAWVSNAEAVYFNVGRLKWIQSQAWLGNFIAHDDNFGPNYCIPRLYVTPWQVQYVLAIHPKGVRQEGVAAEVIGARYIHSLLRDARLGVVSNKWLQRLMEYGTRNQIVLRALTVSKREYCSYLFKVTDWEYRHEHRMIPNALNKLDYLPEHLWVIEVSIPELFPMNKRKLGEMVLDATRKASPEPNFETFLFARLPGSYWFVTGMDRKGKPNFDWRPSRIESHTPLLTKEYETRRH